MGSVLSLLKSWKDPSIPSDNESVDQAVAHLLGQPDDMQSSKETYQAVRVVNLHLLKRGITSMSAEGTLYVNRVLVGMLSSGKFKSCMRKLFKHLLTINTEVNTKNILLVKVFDIHYLEALAKLLLMLSENRSIKIVEDLSRFKLEESTASFVSQSSFPEKTHSSMFPLENFIEMQAKTECEAAYLTLRDTLCGFLKLKTSFLTRSDNTLEILSLLAEHTYVLLVRLFFHPQHHEFMRKFVLSDHSESAVKFGGYFLGVAVEHRKGGLYDLTVKFLTELLHDGQTKKDIVSFPSHLFVHVPLLTLNTIYQFILCNLLKGLSRESVEVQENEHKSTRTVNYMKVNRFETWRLILYLLENEQAKLGMISIHMLEELCKTVRVNEVERVYVNRMIRPVKHVKSEVLEKFGKTEKIDYQLNLPHHSVTLTSQQVFSHLLDYLDSLPANLPLDFEHYLYESIFQNAVEPSWNESILWAVLRDRINHPKEGHKKLPEEQAENNSETVLVKRQEEVVDND